MTRIWQADFESGDLSQLLSPLDRDPREDSGAAYRPRNGVSREQAHSGLYSAKMSIDSDVPHSGCRLFRKFECWQDAQAYVYGAWFYFPKFVRVDGWWNIWQFKANVDQQSMVAWKLEVRNPTPDTMALMLVWDMAPILGPFANYSLAAVHRVEQPGAANGGALALPVGEWVHIEVGLLQSADFDGEICVYQDDVELFGLTGIRTKPEGGSQNWSVNNYGQRLRPDNRRQRVHLYVDDMTIDSLV